MQHRRADVGSLPVRMMADPVVEAFEAWATHPDRGGKLPIEKHPNSAYINGMTYTAWFGWKSAYRSMPLAAVAGHHWQPLSTCPLGATVLLKGKGGVPTQGRYTQGGDDFWVGWAHLPTDAKAMT